MSPNRHIDVFTPPKRHHPKTKPSHKTPATPTTNQQFYLIASSLIFASSYVPIGETLSKFLGNFVLFLQSVTDSNRNKETKTRDGEQEAGGKELPDHLLLQISRFILQLGLISPLQRPTPPTMRLRNIRPSTSVPLNLSHQKLFLLLTPSIPHSLPRRRRIQRM